MCSREGKNSTLNRKPVVGCSFWAYQREVRNDWCGSCVCRDAVTKESRCRELSQRRVVAKVSCCKGELLQRRVVAKKSCCKKGSLQRRVVAEKCCCKTAERTLSPGEYKSRSLNKIMQSEQVNILQYNTPWHEIHFYITRGTCCYIINLNAFSFHLSEQNTQIHHEWKYFYIKDTATEWITWGLKR